MKKYEEIIRKYLKERHWDNLRPADVAKSSPKSLSKKAHNKINAIEKRSNTHVMKSL